jgi:hypothetical protein
MRVQGSGREALMGHKHKWVFMGLVLGGEKNGLAHRRCPGCRAETYLPPTKAELKKHDPHGEVAKHEIDGR